MLVSVCIRIDEQMENIIISWLQWTNKHIVKPIQTSQVPVEKTGEKVADHNFFTKNSIIRNYNGDRSCEQAIFVLHDLRVVLL